jgi:hypothetical protein
MLDPGRYTARAIEADFGTTNAGKPQVEVLFEITQGEAAGERISWFGYFGPKDETKARTIDSLTICGWVGDDGLSGVDTNEVTLVVEHEPHFETGEPQVKVKWVNRLGGSSLRMKSRMTETERRAFVAQIRGDVLARLKQNGAAAPKAAPKPSAARPPQGFVGREPGCDDGPTGDDPFG